MISLLTCFVLIVIQSQGRNIRVFYQMEAIYTFAKNVGAKTLQRKMYESVYIKRTKNDERKRVG